MITWLLVVLFAGTNPPDGYVVYIHEEAECRALEEVMNHDPRYRARCWEVSGPAGAR
jgi:hypothetical protein